MVRLKIRLVVMIRVRIKVTIGVRDRAKVKIRVRFRDGVRVRVRVGVRVRVLIKFMEIRTHETLGTLMPSDSSATPRLQDSDTYEFIKLVDLRLLDSPPPACLERSHLGFPMSRRL